VPAKIPVLILQIVNEYCYNPRNPLLVSISCSFFLPLSLFRRRTQGDLPEIRTKVSHSSQPFHPLHIPNCLKLDFLRFHHHHHHHSSSSLSDHFALKFNNNTQKFIQNMWTLTTGNPFQASQEVSIDKLDTHVFLFVLEETTIPRRELPEKYLKIKIRAHTHVSVCIYLYSTEELYFFLL